MLQVQTPPPDYEYDRGAWRPVREIYIYISNIGFKKWSVTLTIVSKV